MERLFVIDDCAPRTRLPMVPIMMSTGAVAARQDCLFYACSRCLLAPGSGAGSVAR